MEIIEKNKLGSTYRVNLSLCVKEPVREVEITPRFIAAGRQLLRRCGQNPDNYKLVFIEPHESRFDMWRGTYVQFYDFTFAEAELCTNQSM